MGSFYITNIADVLRAAGCKVVEYPGWKTRGHGGLSTNKPSVVWHHDASPKGPSRGVGAYLVAMLSRATGSVGDSQLWVDYDGTWHVLGCGRAFHAGVVRAGKAGNSGTLGVEVDHTVGEAWPSGQLSSLERGTAALLRAYGHSAAGLEFHKTICFPAGRKVDPDGLDLVKERRVVGGLMATTPAKSATSAAAPAVGSFGWLSRRNGDHVDSGTYADASKPLSVAAFNNALTAGKAGKNGQQHGALREVWAVEQALDRVNYLIPELSKDKSAGTSTQTGLDRYRKEVMGLSGADASGSAGAQSLTHLMNAAGIRAAWK